MPTVVSANLWVFHSFYSLSLICICTSGYTAEAAESIEFEDKKERERIAAHAMLKLEHEV